MGLATLLISNIFLKANNSNLAYFNYSLKFFNYRNSEREDPKYLNLSLFLYTTLRFISVIQLEFIYVLLGVETPSIWFY